MFKSVLNSISVETKYKYLTSATHYFENIGKWPSFSRANGFLLGKLKEANSALLEEEIKGGSPVLKALPTYIGLGTDYKCNLKCIMCVQRTDDFASCKDTPPIEEKYLIDFARQVFPTAQIFQLNTAGEPLMSSNFELELELAEMYRVKLDIFTNGTLLNSRKGRMERITRNAICIYFSFDSPNKETYESIRVGADYDRVVENMGIFDKYRKKMPSDQQPHFCITMVIMARNLHEVPQMVGFAKEIGADSLNVSFIHPHTEEMHSSESLDNHREKVNENILAAREIAKKLDIYFSSPPLFHIDKELENIPEEQDASNSAKPAPAEADKPAKLKWCPFLWRRAYIDHTGNIFPCCAPNHPVAGNIKDNSFQEIWNGEFYQNMRKTFLGGPYYEPCRECSESGFLSTTGIE